MKAHKPGPHCVHCSQHYSFHLSQRSEHSFLSPEFQGYRNLKNTWSGLLLNTLLLVSVSLLVRDSVIVINITIQRNLEREPIGSFAFTSQKSKKTTARHSRQEPGGKTDAEVTEEHEEHKEQWLLGCSQLSAQTAFLFNSGPPTQGRHHPHWARPPMSITNYENGPSSAGILSIAVLFSYATIACIKFEKQTNKEPGQPLINSVQESGSHCH